MTSFDEFLKDYKEKGGVYYFTPEELRRYHNKQEHIENKVLPKIQSIGIEEELWPELYKSLLYPGDY